MPDYHKTKNINMKNTFQNDDLDKFDIKANEELFGKSKNKNAEELDVDIDFV